MVKDSSHELSRVMVTTLNRDAVNSPTLDSARNIGKNAAAVVSDEVSNGTRNSLAESIAASIGFLPADMETMMLSVMTIPLSTSMPSAIINAASDIWSRPILKTDINNMATSMLAGIKKTTIRPVRIPRLTSMTAATTRMACTRLEAKLFTLFSTSCGEKLMASNSTP